MFSSAAFRLVVKLVYCQKCFFFKKIEKRTGINFKHNYEMPANQRCWRRGLLDVHLHRWQVIEMWLSNGDSDATEEVLSKRHHCVRKSKILLLVHSSKELRKLLIILQGKPLNVSFGMWYDTEDSSICNNEHLALHLNEDSDVTLTYMVHRK